MRLQVRVTDEGGDEHEFAGRLEPVESARQLIYRLFQSGVIDDESATEALLAIDAGLRRKRRQSLDGYQADDD